MGTGGASGWGGLENGPWEGEMGLLSRNRETDFDAIV